jgi:Ca-activated chloride channel family protein
MLRYLALLLILSTPARACDLALLLAVDVSGSVDAQEYRVQIDGLALALRDGIVADALVQQRAKVSLVQWTGSTRQQQTVPWTVIRSHADVAALAEAIANDPRVWRNYSTAIGEALVVSRLAFAPVADCIRKVIDLSGDGASNEGIEPATQRAALNAENITVNALAIETDQTDLTGYFFENLITGPGAFVVTANGFADYPETIKRKLQRETSKQVTWLDKP